jgi:asparagine synthase (glutamine-hydrolysing)
MPVDFKIGSEQGKWLLRQDWAEALLDENRLRKEGYFHQEPIRKMWSVLMFKAWLEENC